MRSGVRLLGKLKCDRIRQLAVWHGKLWALTETDGLSLWERVPDEISGVTA